MLPGATVIQDTEDVEEFIDKVDEVSRLIEGLQAGTISPEYIDTKQQLKQQKEQEKAELAKKRPAGRGPAPSTPKQDPDVPASQPADQDDENEEAERKERAMAKVKELIANRERKLRARARYEEYTKSNDRTKFGTDYTKWDIWCPEDEEDDLINSIGPNTPQFRAMEKDIDERHRQMVERRQLAERCRVRGNEAYAARQYSEALRCYQQGLESERTNMALHANAAMAALKMSCFVQAIEHCDKVLSIAEFLHNNRKDPLCVKALQRRAEAYRALQQHGRAVRDLEAATELEPGNVEAAKQLARARLEDEEARKQRAVAKAVRRGAAAGVGAGAGAGGGADSGEAAASTSGSGAESGGGGGGSGGAVEAGGLALDLEKLGRLERLAASLAPAQAPSEPSSSGQQAAEGREAPGAASAPAEGAARRGPSLPPRAGKATVAGNGAGSGGGKGRAAAEGDSASPTAAVCSQLRALLRDDDVCCVYFRECSALQHVATKITKRPAGPDPDLAPLLLLLNDACMNDGNLKQLPALKVLPPVVAALDGAGEEAAGAAATLLCTAVTAEEVRREISKLLGSAENLARLVALLSSAKPVVQGVALALLGNCMVDKPVKSAMAAAWRSGAAAADCFLGLLRSPNAVLAEKAAVLLGNMATEPGLRAEMLGRQDGVVRQLIALACASASSSAAAAATAAGGGKGGKAPQQQQKQQKGPASDLQRAASTALFNLTVDEAGQRQVAEDADGLAALYGLVQPPHADVALAARAAGVCARTAKAAAGAAALLRLGALEGMLQVMTGALDTLAASSQGKPSGSGGASSSGGEQNANTALLDAAVRTVTILTSGDDAALVARLVVAGGVAVLLRTIRAASPAAAARASAGTAGAAGSTGAGGGLGESVLANAVLCLAGVARRREQLPVLREADPVPLLVGVAYEGRGSTASKNAAIALARLAQEPAMLERLRELHGIEIIYQYVKP